MFKDKLTTINHKCSGHAVPLEQQKKTEVCTRQQPWCHGTALVGWSERGKSDFLLMRSAVKEMASNHNCYILQVTICWRWWPCCYKAFGAVPYRDNGALLANAGIFGLPGIYHCEIPLNFSSHCLSSTTFSPPYIICACVCNTQENAVAGLPGLSVQPQHTVVRASFFVCWNSELMPLQAKDFTCLGTQLQFSLNVTQQRPKHEYYRSDYKRSPLVKWIFVSKLLATIQQ